MKRRICLKALVTGVTAVPLFAASGTAAIQLHVDLQVNPAREREMLHIFHTRFARAAAKQPGFIEIKMLKLRKTLQGSSPGSANYRFLLSFQTEEDRQKWIATPIHKKLWPTIEATLFSKNYTVLLYDVE